MLNLKKSPVLITKVCLFVIIGAFAFNFLGASFSQRAAAAGSSEQIADSESELPSFRNLAGIIPNSKDIPQVSIGSFITNIVETTGIYAFITDVKEMLTPAGTPITIRGWQELLMVIVGFVVVWLGVAKNFEPLLLVPIGFGIIFVNIPIAGMGLPEVVELIVGREVVTQTQGFLDVIYKAGVGNEFFPLLIFVGIGAMTDFGPLIANPKTAILGAAAQFGVFATLFFISVANYLPGVAFNLKEACSVAIIGGADGPTTIFIAAKLAPHLLATMAVAAYS